MFQIFTTIFTLAGYGVIGYSWFLFNQFLQKIFQEI